MSAAQDQVTASFTLQAEAERYLAEAELGEGLAAARAVASLVEAPFGQLVLAGAGQPPIGLYDDLLPLADGLAALLPDLRAGEGTGLGSYSQPGELEFRPEGSLVVVRNEHGEERRYPAAALAEALAGCLARLLPVLRQLAPQDPAWQEKLARIEG